MGALFSQNCLHANHYTPDQGQDSETVEREQKQRTSNNGGDYNLRISTTRLSLSLPFLKKQQMNSTTVHPSTNGKSSRFGSRRRTRTTYYIKGNKWDVAMWEEQLTEQGHSLTFTHTHIHSIHALNLIYFIAVKLARVDSSWLSWLVLVLDLSSFLPSHQSILLRHSIFLKGWHTCLSRGVRTA